jgi:RNA polymerase-binding transcription factor DksA
MTDRGSALSPAEQRAIQELLAEERFSTTRRLQSLTRQYDAIAESSAWTTNDDEHDPEGATIAFERAQVQGLLSQAHSELDELDRAAERLRDGTYGICERCGKAIAKERLAALPTARVCINCATTRR